MLRHIVADLAGALAAIILWSVVLALVVFS